jgi:hypothetical protein
MDSYLLDENSVVELSQPEQLQNLGGLGVSSHDTDTGRESNRELAQQSVVEVLPITRY